MGLLEGGRGGSANFIPRFQVPSPKLANVAFFALVCRNDSRESFIGFSGRYPLGELGSHILRDNAPIKGTWRGKGGFGLEFWRRTFIVNNPITCNGSPYTLIVPARADLLRF